MRVFKLIILFTIPSYFTSSCLNDNPKTKLVVLNKSNLVIDSILFSLNNFNIKFNKISHDDSTSTFFEKSKIKNLNHDVVYLLKAYSQGKEITKQLIYSNDLGFLPEKLTFALTDSLKFIEFK